MNNLEYYEMGRAVPEEAKRPITGGKLKGKTDISPMWRIKKLTEMFGPVGLGWKYVIKDERFINCGEEIAAFVDIDLCVKYSDGWSEAIPGTGGSMLYAYEKGTLKSNDECLKMALTDAISVACKAIGIAADVYWDADKSKYTGDAASEKETEKKPDTLPDTPEVLAFTAQLTNKINKIVEITGHNEKSTKVYLLKCAGIDKPRSADDLARLITIADTVITDNEMSSENS